jgi:hypothetical protein
VQMWLCAVRHTGAAWLLQFIEDLQQSREFHKVCELKLPDEAATIPEVLLFLSPYSDLTSMQLSIQPASTQRDYIL